MISRVYWWWCGTGLVLNSNCQQAFNDTKVQLNNDTKVQLKSGIAFVMAVESYMEILNASC